MFSCNRSKLARCLCRNRLSDPPSFASMRQLPHANFRIFIVNKKINNLPPTHGFQWSNIWGLMWHQVTEWQRSCRWRVVSSLTQDQCKTPLGEECLQGRRHWLVRHFSRHLNVNHLKKKSTLELFRKINFVTFNVWCCPLRQLKLSNVRLGTTDCKNKNLIGQLLNDLPLCIKSTVDKSERVLLYQSSAAGRNQIAALGWNLSGPSAEGDCSPGVSCSRQPGVKEV